MLTDKLTRIREAFESVLAWRWLAGFYILLIFARNYHEPALVSLGRRLTPTPALLNLAHIPMYALLCWVLWRCSQKRDGFRRLPVLLAILVATMDEGFQAVRSGRSMEWNDWVLNLVGIALCALWLAREQPTARITRITAGAPWRSL